VDLVLSIVLFLVAHPELSVPLLGAVLNFAMTKLGVKMPNLQGFLSAMLPDLGRAALHLKESRKPKLKAKNEVS
jgi:hypothetical protein